jgi:hypothetical protein
LKKYLVPVVDTEEEDPQPLIEEDPQPLFEEDKDLSRIIKE